MERLELPVGPPPAGTSESSSSTSGSLGSAPSAPSSSLSSSFFSPPPPSPPVLSVQSPRNYESLDLSRYTSAFKESSGVNDDFYAAEIRSADPQRSWLDEYVQNPRLRSCIEAVRTGTKMGATVGGIFGGLTGAYAALKNRNFWILPLSAAGGALSFGFFLGCGMIVRCQEHGRGAPLPTASS